jgi:predicted transcriptional regulator
MEKNQNKLLLSKLRRPVHIDYISKYILKTSVNESKKILNNLVNDGIIVKSKLSKDYYVVQS